MNQRWLTRRSHGARQGLAQHFDDGFMGAVVVEAVEAAAEQHHGAVDRQEADHGGGGGDGRVGPADVERGKIAGKMGWAHGAPHSLSDGRRGRARIRARIRAPGRRRARETRLDGEWIALNGVPDNGTGRYDVYDG
jgi:hypothetical protein